MTSTGMGQALRGLPLFCFPGSSVEKDRTHAFAPSATVPADDEVGMRRW